MVSKSSFRRFLCWFLVAISNRVGRYFGSLSPISIIVLTLQLLYNNSNHSVTKWSFTKTILSRKICHPQQSPHIMRKSKLFKPKLK